jgi:hypothetical protein
MSRTPRNICECHCGTRIDINPKLVEERESWREKCIALEENYRQDTAALKEKIYKECSQLMVNLANNSGKGAQGSGTELRNATG